MRVNSSFNLKNKFHLLAKTPARNITRGRLEVKDNLIMEVHGCVVSLQVPMRLNLY